MISKWLDRNRLRLNVSKTKFIIFKPINKYDKKSLTVRFGNNILEQVKEQKFLGVWFHEGMNWTTHINKLRTELSKAMGWIYKIMDVIPLWLTNSLYYSHFVSRLSYSITVWSTTTNRNYNSLITLQNKIIWILENYNGSIQNFNCQPHYLKHSILRANRVYYYKLVKTIYKDKRHITSDNTPTEYSLRKKKLQTPTIRTNYGKQHSHYQVIYLLNIIRDWIDFSLPFQQYKTGIRALIINNDISLI